jgi:hypothetical protein
MGNENAALAAALTNLQYVVEKVQLQTKQQDAMLLQQMTLPSKWPDDFFSTTEGAFANEPFDRPEQGESQERDEW